MTENGRGFTPPPISMSGLLQIVNIWVDYWPNSAIFRVIFARCTPQTASTAETVWQKRSK
jgi:hypothetical protein